MKLCSRNKQSGISLLEVMLVLGIGATILMLANRQYQSIKQDSNVQQTIANVNKLFQAGAEYYMANCKRQWDPLSGPIAGTGTLDPANLPDNPFPIALADLTTQGFFNDTLPTTPVANTTDPANPGYVVQFNMVDPPADREIEISGETTKAKLGQIILYTVQVAVLLRDPISARAYQEWLGAECLSNLEVHGSGQAYVVPCNQVVTPPTFAAGQQIYAVFERLPSYAVPASQSDFWVTTPTVKEFNQLYETNATQYLSTIDSGSYPQQYYLCGS